MENTYKLPRDKKTGDKRILRIAQDECGRNPREDFEPLGTMVCFHSRHNLGDNHEYENPQEFVEAIEDYEAVRLPLFLYDHSGITMRTTPFECRWDSGQVGYIWISKKKLIETYGEDTEATRATAKACLEGEVETYDQYLTGEVYGFEVVTLQGEDEDEDEDVVDSCWGFYGDDIEDNGILDHLDADDKLFVLTQV